MDLTSLYFFGGGGCSARVYRIIEELQNIKGHTPRTRQRGVCGCGEERQRILRSEATIWKEEEEQGPKRERYACGT